MPKPTTDTTLTTFARYQGKRAGNYCTLPTLDVPILEAPQRCTKCTLPVDYEAKGSWGMSGTWVHTGGQTDHTPIAGPACTYCGCTDLAVVHTEMYAWYTAIECDRCGGVTGIPMGD